MVATFLWWEFGIGLVLDPVPEDGCLALELAALVTGFDLILQLVCRCQTQIQWDYLKAGLSTPVLLTQSRIDPFPSLLSCWGALSMAARLGVVENDRVYIIEIEERFVIVPSRKARENIEQRYELPEMRCGYIAVIESKQLDDGGDVIASSGSDLVGR